MTAWTTITNALVAVGAKPFATTMQALRDNPLAMFEGASGAPRLWLPALERLTVGTSIRLRDDTVYALGGAVVTFTTIFSVKVMQPGAFTMAWEMRRIANQTMEARVMVRRARTDTQEGATQSTISTTFVAFTQDVNVQPGDLVSLQVRMTVSSSGGEARNRRVQVDPAVYFWPTQDTFGEVEGNPTITSP